ncbi:MAG: hypothetical protein HYZ53_20695 [Planctomycetes bacterium]|nr:hypothetical protein [Planctomycetota bacterium]
MHEGVSAGGRDRAALLKASMWSPGDILTVSFLDGDPALQERVRAVARTWTAPELARLTLDFRKDTNTAIRISFLRAGSWSVLGTSCRSVPRETPTMNFGWLSPSSADDVVERVVLHEFGHALGLIHEHQNPAGGILWNKEEVYKDLSAQWSKEKIDQNLFEPYAQAETNYTQTDPLSIMMYPIKASWTLNGFSVGLNSRLSPTDRRFVHEQYA